MGGEADDLDRDRPVLLAYRQAEIAREHGLHLASVSISFECSKKYNEAFTVMTDIELQPDCDPRCTRLHIAVKPPREDRSPQSPQQQQPQSQPNPHPQQQVQQVQVQQQQQRLRSLVRADAQRWMSEATAERAEKVSAKLTEHGEMTDLIIDMLLVIATAKAECNTIIEEAARAWERAGMAQRAAAASEQARRAAEAERDAAEAAREELQQMLDAVALRVASAERLTSTAAAQRDAAESEANQLLSLLTVARLQLETYCTSQAVAIRDNVLAAKTRMHAAETGWCGPTGADSDNGSLMEVENRLGKMEAVAWMGSGEVHEGIGTGWEVETVEKWTHRFEKNALCSLSRLTPLAFAGWARRTARRATAGRRKLWRNMRRKRRLW